MKRTMLILCLALAAPLMMLAQSTQVVVFQSVVSPANEVPPRPVAQQASGTSTIVMSIKRNASGVATAAYVDFVMNAYYAAEEVSRAMHIHRGGANVSGPVVLDSFFGSPVTSGPGNATFVRRAEYVSTADLNTVEQVLADPGGYYVNIHTASAPAGILRGQLHPTDLSVSSANSDALADLQSGAADQKAQLDAIQELVRRVALRVGLRP
jgi:hypothetical protein